MLLTIDADSPYRDRGDIRAAVTIRDGSAIVHRDKLNLTSAKARQRFLAALSKKGFILDEAPLVALDEAGRQPPPPPRPSAQRDGGVDFSGTPALDMAGLHAAFERWLLIRDEAYLPVLTGAVLAHRLGSDPVWLLIVAAPGGTKTETLRALYNYPGIYPLSDLSARTLASGLDIPGEDPSLLARLKDEILVLKDFTTVLQKHRDERQAILAQLREVYDGRFDRVWGTGRELRWQGRLGFVAGVTPIIDQHHAAMSVLGERFGLFRPRMPDRIALARKALACRGREVAMRKELQAAMHAFLRSRASTPPTVSEPVLATIARIADFITRSRSGVERDSYRRNLEYAPEPEAPTRFAKVLLSLAQGIGSAYDSQAVTGRELRLVLRVALDSLPIIRRDVIAALGRDPRRDGPLPGLTANDVAVTLRGFSTTTIRRTLEDLHALEVVDRSADRWRLQDRWATIFDELSEASGRCDGPSDISGTATGVDAATPPEGDAT